MRQLLLVRHAKAVWDQRRFADRERPLSAQGVTAAQALGRAMASLGLSPELVLVSPAERAIKTLDCLGLARGPNRIESPEHLYLASAGEILLALRRVPPLIASVLVIAHNPGLHELTELLLARSNGAPERRLRQGFATATLAELALGSPWLELAPGSARLVRVLSPRDLAKTTVQTPTTRAERS